LGKSRGFYEGGRVLTDRIINVGAGVIRKGIWQVSSALEKVSYSYHADQPASANGEPLTTEGTTDRTNDQFGKVRGRALLLGFKDGGKVGSRKFHANFLKRITDMLGRPNVGKRRLGVNVCFNSDGFL